MERKNSAFFRQLFRAAGKRLSYGDSLPSGVVLLAVTVVFSLLVPHFLKLGNLMNILTQSAVPGFAALSLSVVIISGNIDLSIGSMMSFSCTLMAFAMVKLGLPVAAALPLTIGSCVCLGVFNGVLTAYLQMNSLIVTYLSMNFFSGLCYILCDNSPISGIPQAFSEIGRGSLASLPNGFLLFALFIVATSWFLRHSYWGKYILAIGCNAKTARLSGIDIKRTQIITFAISGFFAGIGGTLLCARINYGIPSAGSGYEFTALVIVILSNISLNGGQGAVRNVIIGVLTYSVISTGLIFLNISFYGQKAIIGGLVFISALVNSLLTKPSFTDYSPEAQDG